MTDTKKIEKALLDIKDELQELQDRGASLKEYHEAARRMLAELRRANGGKSFLN